MVFPMMCVSETAPRSGPYAQGNPASARTRVITTTRMK